MIANICSAIDRLVRSRRGNVLMIMGFAIIPLTFSTGMVVDYSRAARLQTKLNAAADAAALAGVTQPMMEEQDINRVRSVVTNMFNTQAAGLPGLVYNNNVIVTITTTNGATLGRTVTVTYQADSTNAFGGVLGKASIVIGGTSTANATKAPFIDFYLLLDTSPSMLLPSTSAGLTQMRSLTGCAFACHLTQPHTENIYVTRTNASQPLGPGARFDGSNNVVLDDGNFADSYWLAQNKGITLRIDAEQTAVQDLVPIAIQTARDNKVKYRMAVNRFDYGPNFGTVASLTEYENLNTITTKTQNLPLTKWYKNSYITQSSNINDQSTDFRTAFDKMNTLMPAPGSGKTASEPQAIMFIITDGMSDEDLGGRTHRELRPTHLDQCAAIKNRNIRIAILYTEYLPGSLDGDSWSQTNVKPYLPNVEPALQQCASTGLYYKVTTDDSISDALTALFRQAVATAHLTN